MITNRIKCRLENGYHFKTLKDSHWEEVIVKTEEYSKAIYNLANKITNILNKEYNLNNKLKYHFQYDDTFYGGNIHIGNMIYLEAINKNINLLTFMGIYARFKVKNNILGNHEIDDFKDYCANIYYRQGGDANPTIEINSNHLFAFAQIKNGLLENFEKYIVKASYYTI